MSLNLLTEENHKTKKGEKFGYLTGILYLTPSDLSGIGNVCPFASKGCKASCLNTAGYGKMSNVQAGRLRKTKLFFDDLPAFLSLLEKDIWTLLRKAYRQNLELCVRLNGTSDIPWEKLPNNPMELFPETQFYDYTKRPHREGVYSNYHLTFSRSEKNDWQSEIVKGRNVAVVFKKDIPKTYEGIPVVDGEQSDLRFLDPAYCIVGLRAKGRARQDRTGFVV